MRPSVPLVAAVLALALAASAWSQPAAKPPRQVGKVSFPTSCSAEAQADFERGVANAGAKDAERAREILERGRPAAKTERERLYLEAIAEYWDRVAERSLAARMKSLAAAFEVLAQRFPEDDEAQVFHALYLSATQSLSDKSYAPSLKAAAILEEQFRKHPQHPGVAHYLIHAYDYPPIAGRGLAAARRYADLAPSAPHALHMPSHIFTRVGAWKESAATNFRSAEAAKAERIAGTGCTPWTTWCTRTCSSPATGTRPRRWPRRRPSPMSPPAISASPTRSPRCRRGW
jgi:hypothetical protein